MNDYPTPDGPDEPEGIPVGTPEAGELTPEAEGRLLVNTSAETAEADFPDPDQSPDALPEDADESALLLDDDGEV